MTAFNERVLNISFLPTENKSYSDTLTLTGDVILTALEIDVTGEAILSNYDILDGDGTSWDIISFLMYSVYDKILEIWQENKHISKSQKKAFAAPTATPLFIRKLTPAQISDIRNQTTNILPPWKG